MASNVVLEHERKFLPPDPVVLFKALTDPGYVNSVHITQHYLADTGAWATRVRQTYVCSPHAPHSALSNAPALHQVIMKRALPAQSGAAQSNRELPADISSADYAVWAAACMQPPILKVRHRVMHRGNLWEVDHFLNPQLGGLILVELEQDDPATSPVLPPWLAGAREVTGQSEFNNAALAGQLLFARE